MSDRLFPLRTLTPELAHRLRRGELRTCRTMHECCLCDKTITLGQTYYDAGLRLRAHFEHLSPGHDPNCTCAEG